MEVDGVCLRLTSSFLRRRRDLLPPPLGPNRHLSDFSDASVVPPAVAPFPTEGPPVRACGSVYYNPTDANLDSED